MNRKERFDIVKKDKGFENDSILLMKIAEYLPSQPNKYEYLEKNKGNFSKKINGKRSFSEDEIIALEKLLDMKFVDMIEEPKNVSVPEYNYESNKYIAYYDKEDMIVEYAKKYARWNNNTLFKLDEFGNSIIDYIIEYNSYNCLRYLILNENIKIEPLLEMNYIRTNDTSISIRKQKYQQRLIKILIENDDAECFNKFVDPIAGPYALRKDTIFSNIENFKGICNTKNILKSIFEFDEKNLTIPNQSDYCINPICELIIDHMLTNYELYKDNIYTVLSYARNLNNKIYDRLKEKKEFYTLASIKTDRDYGIKFSVMIYYDKVLLPNVPDKIKKMVDEINKIVNQLIYRENINRENIMYSKSFAIKDGKIYKKSSENSIQYGMMRKFNEINYKGIPKLYESNKAGVDLIEYFPTMDSVCYEDNLDVVYAVGEFLKGFHAECHKLLGNNKVYLHNNLSLSKCCFKDNELIAVTDWDECSIGNAENDILNALINCTNIADRIASEDYILNAIATFIDGYDAKLNNLSNKLTEYINEMISDLDKNHENYKMNFRCLKDALTIVELNFDEINSIGNKEA